MLRVLLPAAVLSTIAATALAADDSSPASTGAAGATKTVTTPAGDVTTTRPGTATAPGLLRPKTADGTDTTSTTPADAPAADTPAAGAEPATPVRGESVGLTPTDGTVRVRGADGAWSELAAGEAVPNGTVIDARQGTLTLSTVVDDAGTKQSAAFSGAMFSVNQPKTAGPVTELKLRGGSFATCRPTPRRVDPWASMSARRKPVRRLFGSGHGRFRTRGRYAAATVRGTIWITEDYCDRTVVHVKRGVVGVKDLRTGKTVNVHAGSSRTVARR